MPMQYITGAAMECHDTEEKARERVAAYDAHRPGGQKSRWSHAGPFVRNSGAVVWVSGWDLSMHAEPPDTHYLCLGPMSTVPAGVPEFAVLEQRGETYALAGTFDTRTEAGSVALQLAEASGIPVFIMRIGGVAQVPAKPQITWR